MKIVISPYAGLCNRIITTAAAFRLAEVTDLPVTVCWQKTFDCNCRWGDLFKPLSSELRGLGGGIRIKDIGYLNLYSHCYRRNFSIPALMRRFAWRVRQCRKNFDYKKHGDVLPLLKGDGIFFFDTCYPVIENTGFYREVFRPTEELQSEIDSVTAQFSANTIGIHIRRTDHIICKQAADVEDFCKMMDKEIEKDDNVKFYLATDDLQVKKEIIGRYGEGRRIISYETPLNRNSTAGMKGAVIDLWCLSNTSKIIGSFTSTYSITAALLGDIELLVGER